MKLVALQVLLPHVLERSLATALQNISPGEWERGNADVRDVVTSADITIAVMVPPMMRMRQQRDIRKT